MEKTQHNKLKHQYDTMQQDMKLRENQLQMYESKIIETQEGVDKKIEALQQNLDTANDKLQ